MFDTDFYRGKKILITGHTGFKGSWMCKVLIMAGAQVTGYALEAPTSPSLFEVCGLADKMNSVIGDIRDLDHLKEVFNEVQPEIVIHMAAQPLVRESYQNPVYTYETNVMGTVNVLECVRLTSSVRSFVNVTTDKVYLNREWSWGYRENEELNGYDPYSNSKSCSELVTSSYLKSFFQESTVAITTCRAGNVIGGGDFAADRIIPDCIRAAQEGKNIIVRNPFSTRPYQHVLEPVIAYLMIAEAQYKNKDYAGNYNIGPDETDCWTTGRLVDLFCKEWKRQTGDDVVWVNQHDGGPHEANYLKLDCSKIKGTFEWKPRWNVEIAMSKIVEWTNCYLQHGDVNECMTNQIRDFLEQ
ncbi:MAG: CDP-glucose 4,6-dehydratase [Roseburia hominis]